MSEEQHMQTPWILGGSAAWSEAAKDRGPIFICDIREGTHVPVGTNQANARFIVRAVNSHHSLVEALRAALPKCDEVLDRDVGTPCGAIAVWVGSFARHYCDEHHKVDHHPMKVALAGREALALAEKES